MVRVTYAANSSDYPRLNLYTEVALNQIPVEELQKWEDEAESPVRAELIRARTESKFPAGFLFTYQLVSNDPALMRVTELLRNRHHGLFDDFLKRCWLRMSPGLPPGDDFPLCFPAGS